MTYGSSGKHTNHYTTTVTERRYSFYSFLTSALNGVSGQYRALAMLYLRGNDPRYPLDRRLGGPRAGLDTEARGKILCLFWGSNTDHPVIQSVVKALY
jgi:hypothetical protein